MSEKFKVKNGKKIDLEKMREKKKRSKVKNKAKVKNKNGGE